MITAIVSDTEMPGTTAFNPRLNAIASNAIDANAKCDRRGGTNVRGQAHLANDLDYAPIADHLGDFYSRNVERIRERLADGDLAHEAFAIIVGRVFLAVEFEDGWLVINSCGRETLDAVADLG